ncbi:MAG: DUF6542 domain-containing protein [Nakamurella sp.]
MTTATVRPEPDSADQLALASIVPAVRGIPWYGAVLVAVVLTLVGAMIGGAEFTEGVPTVLWIAYLAGCILAVAAVRRRAVFTAIVQPPLVGVLVVFVYAKFFTTSGTIGSAVNVVKIFPMVAIATTACLVIGLIRIFTQPLRRDAVARPAETADADLR